MTGQDEETPETPETKPWRDLAVEIMLRRGELGLTQAEIHARGGPSVATLVLLQGAKRTSYKPWILQKLESALEWPRGTVQRVLDGEHSSFPVGSSSHHVADGPRITPAEPSDEVAQILALIDRSTVLPQRAKDHLPALVVLLAELGPDAPGSPPPKRFDVGRTGAVEQRSDEGAS